MKRVPVDFNILNSEPVGLVKIASPRSKRTLPSFEQGERVLLVDSDLEAEGNIILEDGWIMARPDPATYRDIPVSEEDIQSLSSPQA
ncbi:MAG TPA: hypothetical protein VID72_01845 [Ktedonobacterales bacterium]